MEVSQSRDKLTKRLPLTLLWVAVFLVFSGIAQAQTYQIVDVRVTGNINAQENMIKNTAALKIGSELTGTMLQDAVNNLYAKGIFKDITIDAEQVTAGVVLTIKVTEYPKLNSIAFRGNKKISEKDLNELLRLAPGGYITDHLMMQSRKKIETEYMGKGYFMARANPELRLSPDSISADLLFDIKEYDKVKVETVVLSGTDRLDSSDVVKKMSNRKRGFLRSSDFKKEKFSEDKDKIIEYCRKHGFMDAYIVSDSFAIDTARNRMTIYVDLYEGPQYYFGETVFSGNEIYSDEDLEKALKYSHGNIFDQEKFDESIGELYSAYQEEGYLHIRIMDDRRTRDTTIDITYEIVEGLPSEVRLIEISGNTKTKEKVIRRELMIRPGNTFRRSRLMRSLREVMQLNYFSDVVPDVRDLPSGDVDLLVKVEEKPTGQVSAGAGYSAQDKLVGTFGLGIPNFRGNGQNVSINIEFGSRRNSISLGFTEPWFMGTPTSVGGDLYNINRNWYDDFVEGRRGAAIRLGRRLKWPDNYFKFYWSYRFEDVKYYDFSSSYLSENGETVINPDGEAVYIPYENSLVNFDERWLRTSAMSFTLERDSRDLPMFATDGSRVTYTGEVAGGLLGGEWDYYKHIFQAHRYLPLKWNLSLVAKYKFGYISAHDNNSIPYSERFSPGGTDPDGIVRGYEDAGLSPQSASGAQLHGIAEEVINIELQFPILEGQMYALAFADAGTAWLSRDAIKPFSNLAKGAGVGFRLVVAGVGVIGFDFGYAFDDVYGEGKGWRPHFQLGSGY